MRRLLWLWCSIAMAMGGWAHAADKSVSRGAPIKLSAASTAEEIAKFFAQPKAKRQFIFVYYFRIYDAPIFSSGTVHMNENKEQNRAAGLKGVSSFKDDLNFSLLRLEDLLTKSPDLVTLGDAGYLRLQGNSIENLDNESGSMHELVRVATNISYAPKPANYLESIDQILHELGLDHARNDYRANVYSMLNRLEQRLFALARSHANELNELVSIESYDSPKVMVVNGIGYVGLLTDLQSWITEYMSECARSGSKFTKKSKRSKKLNHYFTEHPATRWDLSISMKGTVDQTFFPHRCPKP